MSAQQKQHPEPQLIAIGKEDLPEPLVKPEVDLSGFPWFKTSPATEISSEFIVTSSNEAIGANYRLRLYCWLQPPVASLPDNPRMLAYYAGYAGRLDDWDRVKDEALHGFVLCSDGRWYHEELAAKANAAWKTSRQKSENAKKKMTKKMANKRPLNDSSATAQQIDRRDRGEKKDIGNSRGSKTYSRFKDRKT